MSCQCPYCTQTKDVSAVNGVSVFQEAMKIPVSETQELKRIIRETQAEIGRLKIDHDLLVSTLTDLAAVARRYLPDYDEHPEIQKADVAIEAVMRAKEEGNSRCDAESEGL